MKKAVKLSAVALFAGLAFGCASQSDFEALQGRVSSLETKVNSVSSTAQQALDAANSASASASRAEDAANQAAASAQAVSDKLDNYFNRTMRK